MNKDEYLNALRLKLEEENISNADDIIDKYNHWFSISCEAGMDDDEAIKLMGTIDDIVKKYQNEMIKEEVYSLAIKTAVINEIKIIRSDTDKIIVTIDDCLTDLVDIKQKNNKIIITDMLRKFSSFHHLRGSLLIQIGKKTIFDQVKISVVSTHTNICEIKANEVDLESVSGDYNIDGIYAGEVKIETISGDLNFDKLNASEVTISTISGDIMCKLCDIKSVKGQTISGDITLLGKVLSHEISTVSGDINVKE